jgi:hypothetical protein
MYVIYPTRLNVPSRERQVPVKNTDRPQVLPLLGRCRRRKYRYWNLRGANRLVFCKRETEALNFIS